MDLDEIFIKCLKWDKEQSVKNTISIYNIGFQSPGILLWSRHSIGGLSCLGGSLHCLSALVITITRNAYFFKILYYRLITDLPATVLRVSEPLAYLNRVNVSGGVWINTVLLYM